MIVIPGNAQALGARSEQQDAFGFSDKDDVSFVAHGGVLAVVADGMGGMAMGRQASQCAVSTILKAYTEKLPEEPIATALTRSLHCANAAVVKLAEEAQLAGEVGTTVVAAVVHQGHLYWVSVGDSHLYRYHQGILQQLSTDHIYATELAKAVSDGELSQAEAELHPERQSLTSYVGLPALAMIDANTIPLTGGDRLLLCSDGLYGTLSEQEMAADLVGDPHHAAETLIHKTLAKQKVHQDNVTAVLMAWESEEWLALDQHKPAVTTTRLSSYVGVSIAIVLVWAIGFVMGRYWETAKRALPNAEQKSENSRSSSLQEREAFSQAPKAQEATKEGTHSE